MIGSPLGVETCSPLDAVIGPDRPRDLQRAVCRGQDRRGPSRRQLEPRSPAGRAKGVRRALVGETRPDAEAGPVVRAIASVVALR